VLQTKSELKVEITYRCALTWIWTQWPR